MNMPAGWYPDPQEPNLVRYFDGTQWTQHTSPLEADPGNQAPQSPQAPGGFAPQSPQGHDGFIPQAPGGLGIPEEAKGRKARRAKEPKIPKDNPALGDQLKDPKLWVILLVLLGLAGFWFMKSRGSETPAPAPKTDTPTTNPGLEETRRNTQTAIEAARKYYKTNKTMAGFTNQILNGAHPEFSPENAAGNLKAGNHPSPFPTSITKNGRELLPADGQADEVVICVIRQVIYCSQANFKTNQAGFTADESGNKALAEVAPGPFRPESGGTPPASQPNPAGQPQQGPDQAPTEAQP